MWGTALSRCSYSPGSSPWPYGATATSRPSGLPPYGTRAPPIPIDHRAKRPPRINDATTGRYDAISVVLLGINGGLPWECRGENSHRTIRMPRRPAAVTKSGWVARMGLDNRSGGRRKRATIVGATGAALLCAAAGVGVVGAGPAGANQIAPGLPLPAWAMLTGTSFAGLSPAGVYPIGTPVGAAPGAPLVGVNPGVVGMGGAGAAGAPGAPVGSTARGAPASAVALTPPGELTPPSRSGPRRVVVRDPDGSRFVARRPVRRHVVVRDPNGSRFGEREPARGQGHTVVRDPNGSRFVEREPARGQGHTVVRDPNGSRFVSRGPARGRTVVRSRARSRQRAETRRLASREVNGSLRVTLTATRINTYDARVYLNTFHNVGGKWRRVDRRQVDTTWYWYIVTARDGVCGFVVRPMPHNRAHVDVSLVVSRSVGCSSTHRYTVPR